MPPIRLDHIAIALPRIADAPPVLVAVLGGVPERIRPAAGFRWATWTYAGGGRLEVLEPLGADGFLRRFLDARGPGIHHVTFKVPGLAEVCRRAERHGYQVVGRDESDPAWKEAFLHPRQAQGIVVQLAETGATAPAEASAALPPGWPAAPPPVRILGLRLCAHSRERALGQWRDVLQGEVTASGEGGLVVRWPDSPMQIVVDVDPTAEEGPLAIELASPRGLGDLEAAGARLGVRLARRFA